MQHETLCQISIGSCSTHLHTDWIARVSHCHPELDGAKEVQMMHDGLAVQRTALDTVVTQAVA